MRASATVCGIVVLLFFAGAAGAAMFTGILTYTPPSPADANDGLFVLPTGGWWSDSNMTIAWTATDVGSPDANYPWKYTYTLTTDSSQGGISHVTIEASPGMEANSILSLTGMNLESVGLQAIGSGNPGMPEDLYGIRFDPTTDDQYSITWSFYCNRMPVWGDFFAKDGGPDVQENVVYNYNNDGFGTEKGFLNPDGNGTTMDDIDPNAPPSDGSVDFHILVPDSEVPEPAAVSLILLGGLAALRRRRR